MLWLYCTHDAVPKSGPSRLGRERKNDSTWHPTARYSASTRADGSETAGHRTPSLARGWPMYGQPCTTAPRGARTRPCFGEPRYPLRGSVAPPTFVRVAAATDFRSPPQPGPRETYLIYRYSAGPAAGRTLTGLSPGARFFISAIAFARFCG